MKNLDHSKAKQFKRMMGIIMTLSIFGFGYLVTASLSTWDFRDWSQQATILYISISASLVLIFLLMLRSVHIDQFINEDKEDDL